MDFQEIKEIIQKEGGKIVIVEQDKPQMVIMSFEEWRGAKKNNPKPQSQVPAPVHPSSEGEELTIDDLPL